MKDQLKTAWELFCDTVVGFLYLGGVGCVFGIAAGCCVGSMYMVFKAVQLVVQLVLGVV